MSRLEDLRKNRLKKLKHLEKRGLKGYPGKTSRTHTIEEALNNFVNLRDDEEQVTLVGRIRAFREHGKVSFLDIEDGSGQIQIFLSENRLGSKAYELLVEDFDVGDFVEMRGILFETKREERSLKAADYKMLSKALRPLPEKWHGLQSKEERYRKRYLDLLFNDEVEKVFERRSEIIKEMRNFLQSKDFLEVETPVLQPMYGGTNAKPFKTDHNALDMELYLRIAPELYLKRLLIGGQEKVFEFSRCFRNEGIDRSHNPEFTSLEFYWAFVDYKELMKLTEKMLETVVKNVFDSSEIVYEDEEIDFETPFNRIEFSEIISRETDLKIDEMNKEGLREEAEKRDIDIEPGANKADICDKIFDKECRDSITQPTFVIHHPKGFQPLAKSLEDNEDKLATFQLFLGGWECANAFSELNDPVEQRKRFEKQEEMREEGFEEAQRKDEAFLTALEHGMPPAAGFGMGVDRLVAILTDSHSLRDVILFPTMKPKNQNNQDDK